MEQENQRDRVEVGDRIVRVNGSVGVWKIHAEFSKRQQTGMWVRTMSHVDVGIQTAGADVGVLHDWSSADAPHSGPVITMVDKECGGRFLIGSGTQFGTLYTVGREFRLLSKQPSSYEGFSRLPRGVIVRLALVHGNV